MSNDDKNELRKYLLGRITDTKALESMEERLFSDDDFCARAELAEEELIQDYVFDKLSREDREAFQEKIDRNRELKFKIEMASALKQKAGETPAAGTNETAVGFFDALRAFVRTPAYLGGFAVALIALAGLLFIVLYRSGGDTLAELKNVYRKERPVEARITSFEYAPLLVTRGQVKDGPDANKLRLIETGLLEALDKDPSAKNHHALGIFYLIQRDLEKAQKELGKAVELDDKNAKFHNDLGSAYLEAANSGDVGESRKILANANEEFTRAAELDPGLLEALFNRSLILQKLDLPQQARESWNLYLQKDPASKWADEARKNLEQLENRPVSKKTKEDILRDFQTARANGDNKAAWNIHSQTKGLFLDISPFEQLSLEHLKAIRDADSPHAAETMEAMNYLGRLENKWNADVFFAKIAGHYEKLDREQASQILNARASLTEGRALRGKNEMEKAIGEFEKSKKLFLDAGDATESYVAEMEAASTLIYTGKIAESRAGFVSLIENAQRQSLKILVPVSYYWLSNGEARKEQISQALATGQTALREAQNTSNFYEAAHTANMLAEVYAGISEQERALLYLGMAIDSKELYYSDPKEVVRNLVTSSQTFNSFGYYSTAADFAMEGLYLSKEGTIDHVNVCLKELTRNLTEKGQLDQALAYADESNRIALGKGQTPGNLKLAGDTFLFRADVKRRMQNCPEAIADYDSALDLYQKLPELAYYIYDAHKGRLLCLQDRQGEFAGELNKVLQLSEEYRKTIREDEDRQAFFDNEQIVFDTAIDNALRQNDTQRAFELAETSRARSLLDFVISDKPIAEVEKDFSSVSSPLSLGDIQARMPVDTQVVQYAVLRDKLAVWRITNDRFEFSQKQITAESLAGKVLSYVKAVRAKNDPAALRAAAAELGNLLLPDNIERDKLICFIPDKSLHLAPFASLVSAEGKLLIESNAVFFSPSSSLLVLTSEGGKKKHALENEKLLGIGNPDFDRATNPGLSDLPQAEMEIASIAKMYSSSSIFTGKQATKEAFLHNISDAEVIHFAGHFAANNQATAFSKLLFAGGDLRAFELAGQRLSRAKLVVLSACDTGLERYNRSEGMIGIARLFLAAGAPQVLASNWPVDSEATKDLMIAFHRNRRGEKLSGPESLRRAQLEMVKDPAFSSPYFWSAFNLVGGN